MVVAPIIIARPGKVARPLVWSAAHFALVSNTLCDAFAVNGGLGTPIWVEKPVSTTALIDIL
jgi:hypothetical protein